MLVLKVGMYISGDKILSGSYPGERGAAAGMSSTAAQLETCVELYASWWHSSADGTCVYGCRLDNVYWQVSVGICFSLYTIITLCLVLHTDVRH